MITAIIFDRDGVLTDFDLQKAADYFRALVPIPVEALGLRWNAWGERAGFPRTLAEEKKFWNDFWRHLSRELDLSPAVESQLQQVDYRAFIRPFADARPALQTARRHNLRVGVLSNFSLASLMESLTAVGLAELVDEARAAPTIGIAKPHPEAYLTITRALGVRPESCLFFDDEAPCVDGAEQLGMHAYRVDRQREEHDWQNHVVADLTAVATLCRQLLPPS